MIPQPPHLDPKRARIRVPLFTKKGVILEAGARFAFLNKKGYFFGQKFALWLQCFILLHLSTYILVLTRCRETTAANVSFNYHVSVKTHAFSGKGWLILTESSNFFFKNAKKGGDFCSRKFAILAKKGVIWYLNSWKRGSICEPGTRIRALLGAKWGGWDHHLHH